MKFNHYYLILIALLFTLNSCSEVNYTFKIKTAKKTKGDIKLGEKVTVQLEQISGTKPDSIHFYVNKKRLVLNDNKTTVNTTDFGIGKYRLTALAFVPGKVNKTTSSIEVFPNKKYTVYNYKIVNTYPHDRKSYTQGLEFHNGYLYETTGRKGESWLRKVDITTGEVLQQYDLNDTYFGEGMTIFNNQIFWLTWQAKKGFVFDLETFKPIKEFKYEKSLEGWGLTHSESELIKSDGTNKIWFLNPNNQKEKRSIQAYTNKTSLEKLNELEFINGKIYANYWQKPLIAIIDPNNGIVDGVIDLTGLVKEMKKTQKLEDQDDVLNGIAYDTENNRLFVTGKHWAKLFEIELIKQ